MHTYAYLKDKDLLCLPHGELPAPMNHHKKPHLGRTGSFPHLVVTSSVLLPSLTLSFLLYRCPVQGDSLSSTFGCGSFLQSFWDS